MASKAVLTCALTGVLTDPAQHHVPVTPEEMAREARRAYREGRELNWIVPPRNSRLDTALAPMARSLEH